MNKYILEVKLEKDWDCKGCLLLEERETTSKYKWGCLLNRQDKEYTASISLETDEELDLLNWSYWWASTYRGDSCPLDKAINFERLQKKINAFEQVLAKFNEESGQFLRDLDFRLDCGHENGILADEI